MIAIFGHLLIYHVQSQHYIHAYIWLIIMYLPMFPKSFQSSKKTKISSNLMLFEQYEGIFINNLEFSNYLTYIRWNSQLIVNN